MVAKSFPRKRVPTKNFSSKMFFRSQNNFLENGSLPKILINNFLVENYFKVAKITCSKSGPYQKFSSKFFYSRKIISSKTGPYQKFSSNILRLKIFYRRKIVSLKWIPTKKFSSKIYFIKNILGENFSFSKNISSKTGPFQKFSSQISWS
jgi:hypothetical protein